MIDPQLLKTNIEAIQENIRKRDLKCNSSWKIYFKNPWAKSGFD